MQAFRVSKGTRVEVCHVNDRSRWRGHCTCKHSEFSEPIGRTRTQVVFRSGKWMMRVKVRDVRIFNGYRWVAMS